ncbi:MAG: isoamylase early set domain-containing protein [Anaerolineae bacterium]|nr:isoamylase early set domain-containing protein [Anaerolineae bacterium]
MPLAKHYLDDKHFCEVTFTLPQDYDAQQTVTLVGEFNAWDRDATTLTRQADGTWSVTLKLPVNNEFQYRYLVDQVHWHNDTEADNYVAHPYGGENSVVLT